MNDTVEDLTSDYDDGFSRMLDLTGRMSAHTIIMYAESAGPKLDVLSPERTFYAGMRDALQDAVKAACDRCGSECSWFSKEVAT